MQDRRNQFQSSSYVHRRNCQRLPWGGWIPLVCRTMQIEWRRSSRWSYRTEGTQGLGSSATLSVHSPPGVVYLPHIHSMDIEQLYEYIYAILNTIHTVLVRKRNRYGSCDAMLTGSLPISWDLMPIVPGSLLVWKGYWYIRWWSMSTRYVVMRSRQGEVFPSFRYIYIYMTIPISFEIILEI